MFVRPPAQERWTAWSVVDSGLLHDLSGSARVVNGTWRYRTSHALLHVQGIAAGKQFTDLIIKRFGLKRRWEHWKKKRAEGKAMIVAKMLRGVVAMRAWGYLFTGRKNTGDPNTEFVISPSSKRIMRIKVMPNATQRLCGMQGPVYKPLYLLSAWLNNWFMLDGFTVVVERCPRTQRCVKIQFESDVVPFIFFAHDCYTFVMCGTHCMHRVWLLAPTACCVQHMS